MIAFTININQKPSAETLRRMSELKDDDIMYDDDCPKMTPEMQKALSCAVAQRNRLMMYREKRASK